LYDVSVCAVFLAKSAPAIILSQRAKPICAVFLGKSAQPSFCTGEHCYFAPVFLVKALCHHFAQAPQAYLHRFF